MTHEEMVQHLTDRINELEQENKELIKDELVVKPTCQKAVETFGKVHAMIVAMEEMAELIQAVTKVLRDKADFENVAEEIADVEICMDLLKQVFNNTNKVKRWKQKKILRMAERIARGDANELCKDLCGDRRSC